MEHGDDPFDFVKRTFLCHLEPINIQFRGDVFYENFTDIVTRLDARETVDDRYLVPFVC